jgi:hypothetical protein
MLNYIEICPVGAEFFHADRQNDGWIETHDEANGNFSQFCKHASKEWETYNVKSLINAAC